MTRRRLAGLAAALAAGLLCGSPASGAVAASTTPATSTNTSLAAAQARAQVINSVRYQLGAQLATALEAQQQLADALAANTARRQALQGEIGASDARLAQIDARLAALASQEAATRDRIDAERAEIRSLARTIYAEPSSVLMVALAARDMGDLMSRLGDLRSAGVRADALKVKLSDDLAALQRQQKEQEAARAEQAKLRDDLAANLAHLEDLRAKQEKAATDLASQINATQAAMAGVDRQSAAVAQQVAALLQQQQAEVIAAAMQAVWDQATGSGITFEGEGRHSKEHRFVWPEWSGTVTQGYGPSQFWFEPPYQGYAHFHTGIDMAQGLGSDVHAVDDGVVLVAGCSCVGGQAVGYGNYVIIAHGDGLETLYGHLSTVLVKAGQELHQGDVVGREGSSGNSTGSHVHFELRHGKEPIDPAPFLPAGGPSPANS